MKLREISSHDTVTQQVIKQMTKYAGILEYAEFYRMTGNADHLRKNASASGGRFRALDNDYPENTTAPVYITPALKILGDKVMVDAAHERRGTDVSSIRAAELLNFASNLGKQFQNYFINGNSGSDANAFDGLKIQVTGSQKITADTNGLSVDLGNSDTAKKRQQNFLELLDDLISRVDGGAELLMMDAKTLSRLSSIAADMVTVNVDEFGKPVSMFNGVPVLSAGFDRNGAKILPHTETVGTGTTCTSIYAVRFGERSDLTLPSNTGVEVKDLGRQGVHYIHSVEFDTALALANSKAAARLEGIIIN